MKDCSVIIVEDEEIASINLEEFLSKNSYDVVDSVSNYFDAIDSIKIYKPKLLICDINLNDKYDGCDVAKFAKDNFEIPTIFISAKHSRDIIDKINQAGGVAYLSKPYNEIEFEVVIEMVCYQMKNIDLATKNRLDKILKIDKLDYYKTIKKLYLEDKEIKLGLKQSQLLNILASTPNIVVSNNYIINYLWEENTNNNNLDKLRQLIKRLRIILGEEAISLVRNIGYVLNCD